LLPKLGFSYAAKDRFYHYAGYGRRRAFLTDQYITVRCHYTVQYLETLFMPSPENIYRASPRQISAWILALQKSPG
jgi:hypothetical protein